MTRSEVSIVLDVSYGQMAVFDPTLPDPFNDWSPEQYEQGFSWRPLSSSFLVEDGLYAVNVIITDLFDEICDHTTKIIIVPFQIDSAIIEIASIDCSRGVAMSLGVYCLAFEMIECPENEQSIKLSFARMEVPRFEIILPGHPSPNIKQLYAQPA